MATFEVAEFLKTPESGFQFLETQGVVEADSKHQVLLQAFVQAIQEYGSSAKMRKDMIFLPDDRVIRIEEVEDESVQAQLNLF